MTHPILDSPVDLGGTTSYDVSWLGSRCVKRLLKVCAQKHVEFCVHASALLPTPARVSSSANMMALRTTRLLSLTLLATLLQHAVAQTAGSSASGASAVSSGEFGQKLILLQDRSHRSFPLYVLTSFRADSFWCSAAMSNLIQQFAAGQSQSQLGLASQAFGLNSGSNSHPFLQGVTSDSKFALEACNDVHRMKLNLLTALQLVQSALP